MLPPYNPASELLKKYSTDTIVKAAAAKEKAAEAAANEKAAPESEAGDTPCFKMWKPDLKALAANGERKVRKDLDRRAAKRAGKRKAKMN